MNTMNKLAKYRAALEAWKRKRDRAVECDNPIPEAPRPEDFLLTDGAEKLWAAKVRAEVLH